MVYSSPAAFINFAAPELIGTPEPAAIKALFNANMGSKENSNNEEEKSKEGVNIPQCNIALSSLQGLVGFSVWEGKK